MDLEFSIVLFENEGYATARGDKGVQDILAAKTGIKGYRIFWQPKPSPDISRRAPFP